jgi:hypothetical protein
VIVKTLNPNTCHNLKPYSRYIIPCSGNLHAHAKPGSLLHVPYTYSYILIFLICIQGSRLHYDRINIQTRLIRQT